MPIVGIRDFKSHACEIVRRVQEERELYIVTSHGRPAAMMIPIEDGEIEELLRHHLHIITSRRGTSGRGTFRKRSKQGQ